MGRGAAQKALTIRPVIPPHTARAPLPSPPRLEPFFKQPWHKHAVRWGLYRPLLKALGWTRREATDMSINRLRLNVIGKACKATRIGDSPEYTKVNHLKKKQFDKLLASAAESASAPSPTPPSTPYPSLLQTARKRFRKHRGQTSSTRAIYFLKEYETMLDDLTSGSATAAKRLWEAENKAASHLEKLPKPETKHTKPAQRYRMNGGFLRPTLYNPPLPQLKPQPLPLSMMIKRRIARRERRIQTFRRLVDQREDMRREVAFLRSLGLDWPEKIGDWSSGVGARSWETEFNRQCKSIDEKFARDHRRSEMKFEDGMYIRIMRAKRKKYERLARRAERRKQQKLLEKEQQGSAVRSAESTQGSGSEQPR